MALSIQTQENEQTSDQSTSETYVRGVNKPRRSLATTIRAPGVGKSGGFKQPPAREVSAARPKRMVSVVSGDWKQGKTHFALTAEPIIYYQSLDLGTEGVIEKFEPANIRLAEYELSIQPGDAAIEAVAEAADVVWGKFKDDFYTGLETDECRTLVWDTESEAWELLRLARFGVLTPKTGRDRGNVWGPVNGEMLGLIRAAFSTDKNFIMLERVKDQYANDKKTGKRERKGFNDAPFIAQVVMRAWREGGSDFRVEILDCRHNPDVNGMVLPNDYNTVLEVVHS